MAEVLLVGKDWTTRALLRAQLIEEGVDVEAHDGVVSALESLEGNSALPVLVIADLSASDNPSRDADQLATWAKDISIWVIASPSVIVEKGLKGRGFQMILFRPVDMNELVRQVRERFGESGRAPTA